MSAPKLTFNPVGGFSPLASHICSGGAIADPRVFRFIGGGPIGGLL